MGGKRQDQCIRGHTYEGAAVDSRGHRICRECKRLRQRKPPTSHPDQDWRDVNYPSVGLMQISDMGLVRRMDKHNNWRYMKIANPVQKELGVTTTARNGKAKFVPFRKLWKAAFGDREIPYEVERIKKAHMADRRERYRGECRGCGRPNVRFRIVKEQLCETCAMVNRIDARSETPKLGMPEFLDGVTRVPCEGHTRDFEIGTKDAVTLCRECPVRRACLEYAIDHRIYTMVWGGYRPSERRRLVRQRMGW